MLNCEQFRTPICNEDLLLIVEILRNHMRYHTYYGIKNLGLEGGLLALQIKIPLGIHFIRPWGGGKWFEFNFFSLWPPGGEEPSTHHPSPSCRALALLLQPSQGPRVPGSQGPQNRLLWLAGLHQGPRAQDLLGHRTMLHYTTLHYTTLHYTMFN